MKKLITIALILFSHSVFAGALVQDAKVVSVENTLNQDSNTFVVNISGGTGPCKDSLVYFFDGDAGGLKLHERAFEIALKALETGLSVDVHSHVNDSCQNATWIKIKNNNNKI
jgi:hypothetical protein